MSITAAMLYSFTRCPHRVFLDLYGDPGRRDDVHPFVELLWERGHAFEEATIASVDVPYLNLRRSPLEQREELTQKAIGLGEPLIYGGRISHGELLGEPDLLRRGETGYEPGDIKSGAGVEGAREDSDGKPKPHYAVQLALYSDILSKLGFARTRNAFVWDVRGEEVLYNLDAKRGPRVGQTMWEEYGAALASVKGIVEGAVSTTPALSGNCSVCHWRTKCREEIDKADDLSLIPFLGRSRRDKFPPTISTVAGLAGTSLSDLIRNGKSTIPGTGAEVLRTFHARAVLQKQASADPYFTDAVHLPETKTELFFDVETDPFRDLCYLHGFVKRLNGESEREEYVPFFVSEPTEDAEEAAFAAALAFVRENCESAVYYYAHHERTTWRHLAQRFPGVATEEDVTTLFREKRFVNLYDDVTRPYMIWPTHTLSLKDLAKFLGFKWRDPDPSGVASIQWFHEWVESGDESIRRRILEYNEDDCLAMRALVDKLQHFREKR